MGRPKDGRERGRAFVRACALRTACMHPRRGLALAAVADHTQWQWQTTVVIEFQITR
jgi:hypothetical protein